MMNSGRDTSNSPKVTEVVKCQDWNPRKLCFLLPGKDGQNQSWTCHLLTSWLQLSLHFFFFSVYIFIFERQTERERERVQVGRGRERGKHRIESEAGSRLWGVSTEPDVGLKFTTHEILTWAKVGSLADRTTQAPPQATACFAKLLGLCLIYKAVESIFLLKHSKYTVYSRYS